MEVLHPLVPASSAGLIPDFPSCSSARRRDLTLGSWRVTAKPLLQLPPSPNVTLVKVRDKFLHCHKVWKVRNKFLNCHKVC